MTEMKELRRLADPTDAMIDAALAVDWECDGDERAAAINVWHAMYGAMIEAAKSAAQTHFEAAIRSALSDDRSDEMREVASRSADYYRQWLANKGPEEPVKIMPRGGVERNWWEEYQLLLRSHKKLAKAARQCLEEVDVNLSSDHWPVKYRAPFGSLTKLREALPETYDEFKNRASSNDGEQRA